MVSAFSVPKSKRDEKIQTKPGPGQYNHQRSPKITKPADPKFSFGKQHKSQKVLKVPGPGAYEGKADLIKDKKPSYSIYARRQGMKEKYNIAPGQYDPTYQYSKDKAPSYSLGGRDQNELKMNKVGPGQYNIKSVFQAKKSGYHFSKDKRDTEDKGNVPGPGSYQHQNASLKYGNRVDPSYGFASKLKSSSLSNVPGPGQYDGKYNVYSKVGGILPKQTRMSSVDAKTPGPGSYNHDYSKINHHQPKWSQSRAMRSQVVFESAVGPGSYDSDKRFKDLVTKNKGYNFGSQKRLKADINGVPGPGNYDGDNFKSKKNIKIGERLKYKSVVVGPGPGSYQNEKYDYTSWMKGKGKYSLAKQSRDAYQDLKVPGPGSYGDSQNHRFRGKVTFARDQKLKYEKNLNPGPGEYSLKPTFADVPKYLLPDKN